MHFGGVQLQDDGVAFHLFALYSHPDLLKGVSAALVNAMRGMTCFFIEALSPEHLQELTALTQASFERFRSDGLV
jgi:sulfur transfer protein SufE